MAAQGRPGKESNRRRRRRRRTPPCRRRHDDCRHSLPRPRVLHHCRRRRCLRTAAPPSPPALPISGDPRLSARFPRSSSPPNLPDLPSSTSHNFRSLSNSRSFLSLHFLSSPVPFPGFVSRLPSSRFPVFPKQSPPSPPSKFPTQHLANPNSTRHPLRPDGKHPLPHRPDKFTPSVAQRPLRVHLPHFSPSPWYNATRAAKFTPLELPIANSHLTNSHFFPRPAVVNPATSRIPPETLPPVIPSSAAHTSFPIPAETPPSRPVVASPLPFFPPFPTSSSCPSRVPPASSPSQDFRRTPLLSPSSDHHRPTPLARNFVPHSLHPDFLHHVQILSREFALFKSIHRRSCLPPSRRPNSPCPWRCHRPPHRLTSTSRDLCPPNFPRRLTGLTQHPRPPTTSLFPCRIHLSAAKFTQPHRRIRLFGIHGFPTEFATPRILRLPATPVPPRQIHFRGS